MHRFKSRSVFYSLFLGGGDLVENYVHIQSEDKKKLSFFFFSLFLIKDNDSGYFFTDWFFDHFQVPLVSLVYNFASAEKISV